MPKLTLTSKGFPSSLPGIPSWSDNVVLTWDQLVWAAITVGKARFSDLAKYGQYSQFELIYRASLMYANLKVSGWLVALERSEAYAALDPSEKGAISYFLGLAVTKLLAEKYLGVPWLMHLDVNRSLLNVILFGSGERPDLIGQDWQGRWVVMESKGRSRGFDPEALAKAKAQTAVVRTIKGVKPWLRVAVEASFQNEMLQVAWEDPDHDEHLAGDLQQSGQLLEAYYGLVQDVLTESHSSAFAVEFGGREYSAVRVDAADLTVGLDVEVLVALREGNLANVIQNLAGQLRDRPQLHQVYIGTDGVLVQLGERWSEARMRREPSERAWIKEPTMERLNVVGIESPWGYRTVELLQGDLADGELECDVLVVSAFAGDYSPVPGTLIAMLREAYSLNVEREVRSAEYDLRTAFGLCVSREIEGRPFKRLLVLDMLGGDATIPESIRHVFVALAALEANGVRITSVAMPFLGTGSQRIPMNEVMPALLSLARDAVQRLEHLEKVVIFERNATKARLLNEAMDVALRRTDVVVAKSKVVEFVKANLRDLLDDAAVEAPGDHQALFTEFRTLLDSEEARGYQVGVLGRRLAEFTVDEVLAEPKAGSNLYDKIEKLKPLGVSPWVCNYLHSLRIMGNESVHEGSDPDRVPRSVAEDDLTIALLSCARVLEFWLLYRTGHAKKGEAR